MNTSFIICSVTYQVALFDLGKLDVSRFVQVVFVYVHYILAAVHKSAYRIEFIRIFIRRFGNVFHQKHR